MDYTQRPPNTIIDDFHGKEKGKTALIILGGSSGKDWEKLRDEVKPDVIIGVNAVKKKILNLDYWSCHENMTFHMTKARLGDNESLAHALAWQTPGPKFSFVNYKSFPLLKRKENVYPIASFGLWHGFNFREYGRGLLCGQNLVHKEAHLKPVAVGTGLSRVLHLAGILGISKIHTIGADLCFKDDSAHHWYEFPIYKVDHLRTPEMFVEYLGLKTQQIWIESAEFLLRIKTSFMAEAGVEWIDHSDGLLQRMM